MRWIFFAIACLFGACAPKVLNSVIAVKKDSIVYITKHVHDTVKVKADAVATIFVGDSTFDEHIGRAELKVTVNKGKTTAICRCDSLTIAKKLAVHDTVHHYIKEVVKTRTEIKFITSTFDRFCRWFFIACCCVCGIYFGVKIAKV